MFNGREPKNLPIKAEKYYKLSKLTLELSLKRKIAGAKGGKIKPEERTLKAQKTELLPTQEEKTLEGIKKFGCSGNLNHNNPILDGVDFAEFYDFVRTHSETHSMSLYRAAETFRNARKSVR